MPSTKITLEEAKDMLDLFDTAYRNFYQDSEKYLKLSDERTNTKTHDYYVRASEDVKVFIDPYGFSSSWIWGLFIDEQSNKPEKKRRYFNNSYLEYFQKLVIFYQDHIFMEYDENNEPIFKTNNSHKEKDEFNINDVEDTISDNTDQKGFSVNNPEWLIIVAVLTMFLPLVGIIIILIIFYRINIHFKTTKNKILKNIILSLSIIVNLVVTYITNDHFKIIYTESQINQLVNDTISKTKNSIRRAQFNTDPNAKGKGILSFGSRERPSDEYKVPYLKPGDSKEIVVNCRLANYGSFAIYNLTAKLAYDSIGSDKSTRLVCILESDNIFDFTDSAYLTGMPESWSLSSIFAEVNNTQDTKCEYCTGYCYSNQASSKQIDQTGIPLGDLDSIKGTSNGKECPCDIIDISFHLLVTNTSYESDIGLN